MFSSKPSLNKHEKNLARAGAYDDLKKIRQIQGRYAGFSLLYFIIGFILIVPLHIMLFGGLALGERITLSLDYFKDLFALAKPNTGYNFGGWVSAYIGWYFSEVWNGIKSVLVPGQAGGIPIWKSFTLLTSWAVATSVPLMLIKKKTENLDATPNIFGNSRWANENDIDRMSKKDLVGFDGKLFLLGKLNDKYIRMKETLSVLLLAPPGTGKTAAFIVPSTVMMDTSCLMLNDQKPELFFMTSGHRATLGPVFQLMWSAQDKPDGGWMTPEQVKMMSPDLLELDETGAPITDLSGNIKVKPTYFPSWNPLGPSSIPPAGPGRDLYIERLAAVLAPDPSSGDKFWTSKARAALIGLVHYITAKTEMSQSDLYPNITDEGIPSQWKGKEASFPLLVDWFTEAQNRVEDLQSDDPMREVFKLALQETRDMDLAYEKKQGSQILNRAKAELTALMNSPDKTRGSILTTLDEALGPFKNEAVRQRTSASSFSFNELRGRPKADAKERELSKQKQASAEGKVYLPRYKHDEWDPITIYICVNAEDAKAFATITGIFVDSANAYLVANGSNSVDDRGNQLGPHDFFFLLDETPTLPKLDTVVNGPAVGRSKRVSYAIVGQDFSQIETRYSKAEVETMKSTTAMKVVLSQNNETAAKQIAEMAGSMTYMKSSYGKKDHKDPISKFFDFNKEIITSQSWEKRSFIDPSFVMAMPEDKHIVLVQNFMNRPILADTPKFFLEPEILKRVLNLRNGKGPKPSLPMPAEMMKAAREGKAGEKDRAELQRQIDMALADELVAIIVTPQNISDISRDVRSETRENRNPVGSDFAIAIVHLHDNSINPIMNGENTITVTSDGDTIARMIENRRVYYFNDDDLDAIKNVLPENRPLHDQLLIQNQKIIMEIDDETETDIFVLGEHGCTNSQPPRSPSDATPEFAWRWFAEMVILCDSYVNETARLNTDME